MIAERLFLVGLPGSGKTTYGKQLAKKLKRPFIDLDDMIIESEKRSIKQVFEDSGESYFREVERRCLTDAIQNEQCFIMATGGGTPCFFDNLEVMNQEGLTIYLKTPIEVIQNRLQADESRPLMRSNTIEQLYNKRKSWYEQAQKTVENYDELLEALGLK